VRGNRTGRGYFVKGRSGNSVMRSNSRGEPTSLRSMNMPSSFPSSSSARLPTAPMILPGLKRYAAGCGTRSLSVVSCSGLGSGREQNQQMFHKVRDIVRSQGVSGLARRGIKYAYRRGVRPCMPSEPVRYAGIPICYERKWGDRLVPTSWIPSDDAIVPDEPDYETALVAGLHDTIRPGDSVVLSVQASE
jgi:hypothetical protein